MLTPYRGVLAEPGALRFSLAALVGRMPISMVGLGIVLLVSARTGSYGLAGAVSAAYLLANGAMSVVQGRLLDRLGQGRVLPVAIVGFAASLTAMVTAVERGWPALAVYVGAALAGATLPPLGTCVRARWSHVLAAPGQVQTAYALESVADEVVFIVGPVLVTALATAWHPAAGLAAAAVLGLTGTLAFAALRATEPPAHRSVRRGGTAVAMPWAAVASLGLTCVALGALFGGAEVTTVAFAEEQGAKRLAGALLATWAFGSLLSGIITGAIAWRIGPGDRLRRFIALLAAAMLPLVFVDSLWLLAIVIFAGGFAIAPTLIATNSLTERVVPRARLSEGMAITHTGIAAGVALGAMVAGRVVDVAGASPAYLVPFGAGALGALVALTAPRGTESAPPAVVLPGVE